MDTSKPSLTISSITFSDNTRLEFSPVDVVVFVGPNNSGKSAALREIAQQLGDTQKLIVTLGATVNASGTSARVEEVIASRSKLVEPSFPSYQGYRFNIPAQLVRRAWETERDRKILAPFFCLHIGTETRIIDSDPASNVSLLDDALSHPIHLLQTNEDVETKISRYFRRAFGADLIVYRGGGNKVPLFVGQRPEPEAGEDRVSSSYLRRLRETTVPLKAQGDGMRSFASVILNMLSFDYPSTMLLDEPEAFLHPPQARLLGEFVAKERSENCQLFISTHSPDVLYGLLNGSPKNLRIIRIERHGQVNRVSELGKQRTSEIANDPILKYTPVFQGIFHQHVFICESDADCLFYSSILDLPSVRGETQPDALFIHAGGKHRVARLSTALRALNVPVSIIVDMDALNEENTIRQMFESLGGSWATVRPHWISIKTAIEEHKPWLNTLEIKNEIQKELADLPTNGEFPRIVRQRIEKLFRKASPWDTIKHGGRSNIPSGQATQRYNEIDKAFRGVGLWLTPEGELEGFCRSIEAVHGPAWVQRVLEMKDLTQDAELSGAREFVREI
jgi:predicted ATPase